jgi:hypothetical protein
MSLATDQTIAMDLSKYVLPTFEKHNNDYLCPICLDDNDEKIIMINCNHTFHNNCITQHIKSKIEDKREKIFCPLQECTIEISYRTISSLLDEETLLEYKKNKISYDDNYCLCSKCKLTYCEKKNGKFIDHCTHCNTTHCFQCGKDHSVSQNCFEMDEESKQSIINFYKNYRGVLKICPACSMPQEKIDGCDEMFCGKNSHNDSVNLSVQGCGTAYKWSNALLYQQNCDAENQIQSIPRHDGMTPFQIAEERRNKIKMYKSRTKWFLFILLIAIIIYLAVTIGMIISKNNTKKNKYCNAKIKYVDEHLIDQSCLNNNNISTVEYQDCLEDLLCWNYGDNIYTELCYSELAYEYENMCEKYNDFATHTDVYYCNNLKHYDGVYACDKNTAIYYIIMWFSIMIIISTMFVISDYDTDYSETKINIIVANIIFSIPFILPMVV